MSFSNGLKCIQFSQSIVEYGSTELLIAIIHKFVQLTLTKATEILFYGMSLNDWQKVKQGAFILKGSVGQLLAMKLLKLSGRLYKSIDNYPNQTPQVIIDIYHRYFDVIDEILLLTEDIEQLAEVKLDKESFQKQKSTIFEIYLNYLRQYCKPETELQNQDQQTPFCKCMIM